MKIATWNVNSVKSRLPHLLDWLAEAGPDVLLLQEIKCVTDAFPGLEVGDLGYNVAVAGQKTYNGVAVLSRFPLEVDVTCLPGDPADDQARYLEAVTGPAGAAPVRVAAIYLPNGNPVEGGRGAKFLYKLGWMDRLAARARELLKSEEAFVLGGDFNVAPDDGDVYDPKGWRNDALCRPETRAAYRRLIHLGLTDAIRGLSPEVGRYTWWDYRAGAWQKDHGLRIDHLLLSPLAADRLLQAGIDRTPRGWDKPSDHTPVWCELAA